MMELVTKREREREREREKEREREEMWEDGGRDRGSKGVR